jgi:ribonuclease HI
VRGHNGHPLNELADRLAVLARRNREIGVDEVTNARMIASIRQEAKHISGFLSSSAQPAASLG